MKCCRCGKVDDETRWYKTTTSTMCAPCQIEYQKEVRRISRENRREEFKYNKKRKLIDIAREYNRKHPFKINKLQMLISLAKVSLELNQEFKV